MFHASNGKVPTSSIDATVVLRTVRVRVELPEGAHFEDIRRLILEAAMGSEAPDEEPRVVRCSIPELEG